MARPKGVPFRQIHVRIPEELYAEMVLLYPELQDPVGTGIRYASISNHFRRLIREDNDRRVQDLYNIIKENENAPDRVPLPDPP